MLNRGLTLLLAEERAESTNSKYQNRIPEFDKNNPPKRYPGCEDYKESEKPKKEIDKKYKK